MFNKKRKENRQKNYEIFNIILIILIFLVALYRGLNYFTINSIYFWILFIMVALLSFFIVRGLTTKKGGRLSIILSMLSMAGIFLLYSIGIFSGLEETFIFFALIYIIVYSFNSLRRLYKKESKPKHVVREAPLVVKLITIPYSLLAAIIFVLAITTFFISAEIGKDLIFMGIILLLATGVPILVILGLLKGYSWARNLTLLLSGAGILMVYWDIIGTRYIKIPYAILSIILLALICGYLIFNKEAIMYFTKE